MLRKLICPLLCTALFGIGVSAADIPERVEISFSVGDSILNINGESVEVDTLYVVNGTTLVPLRVITEAFGSDVQWDGADKTIYISYPDIEITLQIDSRTALVNGEEVSLLEAPVVTENDRTMVPLRFISETFGAEVSYDEDTRGITVILDNSEPEEDSYDGVSLTDEDFDKFVGTLPAALERFEQHFLPQRLFNYREEADLVWKSGEAPAADFIAVAWDMALDEQLSEVMYSAYGYDENNEPISENIYDEATGYYVPDDEYPAFFDYTVGKAGFTFGDVMTVSDVEELSEGYSYVLISRNGAAENGNCQFIAITYHASRGYRYFTCEAGMDGIYSLCEVIHPAQHRILQTIAGTEQSFINAIRDILS